MSDALSLDEDDTFRPIGEAAQSVVEKLTPSVGDVRKIPITGRDQWLDLRKRYVTASDVASICGVGRRSPLQVWSEKTGRTPPIEDNKVMQKGRWFEPAIFEAMGEKHPDWTVNRAKVFLAADALHLGATPDGVAVAPGHAGIVIVQGKVVARPQFREKWMDDPEDDFGGIVVPLEYQIQTLTEAMLAGAPHAYVAALVHDTYTADLHLLPVPRHAQAEQRILNAVGEFWSEYIEKDRQPEPTPGKDAAVLRALYPVDDGATIDLAGDNEVPGLVEEFETLGKTESGAKKRRDEVKTLLIGKLRAAQAGRLADGRLLTFKTHERAGYTVEPTSYRQLRVAKGGRR